MILTELTPLAALRLNRDDDVAVRVRALEAGETVRLMGRIGWWERRVAATGGSMDNNPSAGNKAGGLTTILEKSLGAVAKAGSSPLNAVYGYAEPVTAPGLGRAVPERSPWLRRGRDSAVAAPRGHVTVKLRLAPSRSLLLVWD